MSKDKEGPFLAQLLPRDLVLLLEVLDYRLLGSYRNCPKVDYGPPSSSRIDAVNALARCHPGPARHLLRRDLTTNFAFPKWSDGCLTG